jgi:hypothetical protein
VVHGIWATLDVHFDWVMFQIDIVNTFNTLSHKAIFLEFWAMGGQVSQLVSFVHSFYGLKIHLYFNHHYSSRVLFIIFSFMSTCQVVPRPICKASFCTSSFSCFALFFKGFPFMSLPFPSQ